MLIGVGGMLSANARYLASTWAANAFGMRFPFGTLLVNGSGSFLLGLLLTLLAERFHGNANASLLMGTGFLGAFMTFSTFSYETVHLVQHDQPLRALVYVAASIADGLTAASSPLRICDGNTRLWLGCMRFSGDATIRTKPIARRPVGDIAMRLARRAVKRGRRTPDDGFY